MESVEKVEPVSCLILNNKLFSKEKHRRLLQEAQQLGYQQVHLNHNECPTIIKEITHCRFPKMLILQLSYNNIGSIEALSQLQAPRLKNLHLSFNEIKEARTLRKCHFPFLEKLSLMATKIIDLQFFTHCNFPKLQIILLEDVNQQSDKRISSVGILAKLGLGNVTVSNIFETVELNKHSINAKVLEMVAFKK